MLDWSNAAISTKILHGFIKGSWTQWKNFIEKHTSNNFDSVTQLASVFIGQTNISLIWAYLQWYAIRWLNKESQLF